MIKEATTLYTVDGRYNLHSRVQTSARGAVWYGFPFRLYHVMVSSDISPIYFSLRQGTRGINN